MAATNTDLKTETKTDPNRPKEMYADPERKAISNMVPYYYNKAIAYVDLSPLDKFMTMPKKTD